MTPAESMAVFDRCFPVAAVSAAAANFAAVGLDARRVAALDVVRVLPAVGNLPPEADAFRAAGRRYVVRFFDRLTATVGLRAFPAAEPAPGCVFADAGGLAALRAPGGARRAVVVADGLPRFLRAALRPAAAPCTLGVVTAADWTPDLAERLSTRAASVTVAGSAALAAAVRAAGARFGVEPLRVAS